MDHELTTTPDQEHPKEGKRWGGAGDTGSLSQQRLGFCLWLEGKVEIEIKAQF